MFKDYYQILGIQYGASFSDIKSAYRQMSLKWHPDRNAGEDVTSIMQDINEAYAILKDQDKRARYDNEYLLFVNLHFQNTTKKDSSNDSYTYNYNVKDESLKKDMEDAKEYAKTLVNELLQSFKNNSVKVAKGAWQASNRYIKGYIYASIIFLVFGGIISICSSTHHDDNTRLIDIDNSDNDILVNNMHDIPVNAISDLNIPTTWTRYVVNNNAFSIAIPNTLELRQDSDTYTRNLKESGIAYIPRITFQQKGLSEYYPDALKLYCRILISYFYSEDGDFGLPNESATIDDDDKALFKAQIIHESRPFDLIGEPTYKWINIDNIKAIEIKYRRNGLDNTTNSCITYYLYNKKEFVHIVMSYREQDNIWNTDINNIIQTFKWLN